MKKLVMVLAVMILLVLDWTALVDIMRGEPDVIVEWIVLGLSLLVFEFILREWLRIGRSRAQG